MTSLKHIDLNLLKTFDTLMDERNVSRAADRLALTQPAVSGMLARLRISLGDPLFIRSQYGIVPTERALELSMPVKKILHDIEKLVAPIEFLPQESRMTLSIAATDYSLQAAVKPFVFALKQQAPKVRVAVRWIDDEKIFEQMERGQLDLALMTPDTAHDALQARSLFDETYVCVLREGHPLSTQKSLTLDQFCALEYVIVSYVGGAFLGATDTVLASLGRQRNVVLSVPSFLSAMDVVSNSDLCAVIPSRLVIGRSDIAVMGLPFDLTGFTKLLVWHKRTHDHAAYKWARQLMYDSCNNKVTG
ncbi:LysR family transcriptional regulator [Marinomonas pontica]|uniref:LysR family transcriptional regulator n=1 Tax=Marinomonas pontica TaxID=264739 RepID=UPI0022440369|nr:LysR family transcriptional regulator [Marinomonas pontica]MCW8354717.1 LysR family transcriptional regulator [Marinomonas pontica]